MSKALWLEPEYYNSFVCKCGECRHACCKTWKIAVREDEYYRLIGMECSEKLHEKLESAFGMPDYPTKERFRLIEPDWQGQCRMLDEDGLCMLQKECGEAAISEVCRVYPRSLKSKNGRLQACCSASCEKTVELLTVPEKLKLVYCEANLKPEIAEATDEHLEEIGKGVITILQDRSMKLKDRIAMICRRAGFSEVTGYNEGVFLKGLSELSEECESLEAYSEAVKARYGGLNDEEAAALYKKDAADFESLFPDWEKYFENYICNNMLYADMPCVDSRVSIGDACKGLALQYVLLRQICVVQCLKHKKTEDFIDAVAACYHLIEHTAFYYNATVLLKNPFEALNMCE